MFKKSFGLILILSLLLSACGNSESGSANGNIENEVEENINEENTSSEGKSESKIYDMTSEEYEAYVSSIEFADALKEYEGAELLKKKTSSTEYPASWTDSEIVDAELDTITIKTVYKSDDNLDYVFFIEYNDYDCRGINEGCSYDFVFNETMKKVTKSKAKDIGLTYRSVTFWDYRYAFITASFRGEEKEKDISVTDLSLYFTDGYTGEAVLIPLSDTVETVDFTQYIDENNTIYSSRMVVIDNIPYAAILGVDCSAGCYEKDNAWGNWIIGAPEGFVADTGDAPYICTYTLFTTVGIAPIYPNDFSEAPIDINSMDLVLPNMYSDSFKDFEYYKNCEIVKDDDGNNSYWEYSIDYITRFGVDEDISGSSEYKEMKAVIVDLKERKHLLSVKDDNYTYQFGYLMTPLMALNIE